MRQKRPRCWRRVYRAKSPLARLRDPSRRSGHSTSGPHRRPRGGQGVGRSKIDLIIFVAKRVVWFIPVLLGLITITFFAGHASVRNPCAVWVGPHASPDTVQSCIQYFGVNQPVWDQYKNYIANLVQGNWGKDPQGGTPVLPVILTLFPATIELLVSALFLMIVVGIPLGVIAANNSGRWPDHLVRQIGRA